MKEIDIQIKAIKPNSSLMPKSAHPATVHKHNSVFVPISQTGVSDSIPGPFHKYGLHSKAMHVHLSTILESGKTFTGGY